MRRILMMSVSSFKERTEVHTNTDNKLIQPKMLTIQDTKVMTLLGSKLYDRILDLIEENIMNEVDYVHYKELLEDYIHPVLENYTLSKLAIHLTNQFSNTGLNVKTPENTSQSSEQQTNSVSNDFLRDAQFYSARCKAYLLKHGGTGESSLDNWFPEYLALDGDISQVAPDKQAYKCPIYLGTSTTISKEEISKMPLKSQILINTGNQY